MILPDPIFTENAQTSKFSAHKNIAIVGGGPAGLMAADAAAAHGHTVTVFDSMPSVGRKFLMAGRGGLNLTHSEPYEKFVSRYGSTAPDMRRFLDVFGPEQILEWCKNLGIETFVGSSGRVFPKDFKAAPLLRTWTKKLRTQGVIFRVRHRWIGWTETKDLLFQTPDGLQTCKPDATILALGGGSWPTLGSDGAWITLLENRGIACTALKPSNCGFDMDWSEHLSTRFAGTPLKSIVVSVGDQSVKGDVMMTQTGLEGGPIYALSALIRGQIELDGRATLHLDLCPDWTHDRLIKALSGPRGSRSLSSHLKRTTGLAAPALALLHEHTGPNMPQTAPEQAALIKALPLTAHRPRPLAEAISTAGGVSWGELDEGLQVKALPGLFVSGEMLDWEAPTGGYLLTGCLSTGYAAGIAASR